MDDKLERLIHSNVRSPRTHTHTHHMLNEILIMKTLKLTTNCEQTMNLALHCDSRVEWALTILQ